MDRQHVSPPPGSFLRMLFIAFAFSLLTESMVFLSPYFTLHSSFNIHILVGAGTIAALAVLFLNAFQWYAVITIPFLYAAFRTVFQIIVPPMIIHAQPKGDIMGLPVMSERLEINALLALCAGVLAANTVIALLRSLMQEEKKPQPVQEDTLPSAM